MSDDIWQNPQEVEQPAPRPLRARIGGAVVVGAALATLGIGGVAAASSNGVHGLTTHPAHSVTVDNGSTSSGVGVQGISSGNAGTAARGHGDCLFHSGGGTTQNSGQPSGSKG